MTDSEALVWTQPEWIESAERWIRDKLNRRGIAITGPLEQPHIRPWSTVFQVPTGDGALYFKAVAPDLRYEAALTELLSCTQPGSTPHVLGADRERGWLVMAHGGTRLREVMKSERDVCHWLALLPLYAGLQIDFANRLDELLAIGVPDRRLASLPARFEALLADTEMIGLGRPDGLDTAEHKQLKASVGLVARLCEQLAAYQLPETLEHSDLHDGNIFVSEDGSYKFFDWGDSGISHPFFSLRVTYVSMEYSLGLAEDSPWFERLIEVYLEPWVKFAETEEQLQAAFRLAQRLAPIISALRWLPAIAGVDEAARSDYAGAIPNLLREFLEVNTVQPEA